MKDHQKKVIIDALKQAYKNTLDEQDIYRNIMEQQKEAGNLEYIELLPKLGWVGFLERMDCETAPPCHQEREKILKRDSKDCLPQIKIRRIEDWDIQVSTYFLGEVVDQCKRLKSIAKFLEILNASPEDSFVNSLYGFWKEYDIRMTLAKEEKELGNYSEANELKQTAKAYSDTFDIFSKNAEEILHRQKNMAKEDNDRLLELIKSLEKISEV